MVASRAFALDVSQPGAAAMALDQDWHALGVALSNLGSHLATTVGLDASLAGLLQWLAVIAAIYLLVLNRTNWRTNLLTALLVPYLALQLPQPLFGYLRGDIGAWIAFIAVVIRLFFAQKFPELINGDMELPIAFILLVVTAPKMIVHVLRHRLAPDRCLLAGPAHQPLRRLPSRIRGGSGRGLQLRNPALVRGSSVGSVQAHFLDGEAVCCAFVYRKVLTLAMHQFVHVCFKTGIMLQRECCSKCERSRYFQQMVPFFCRLIYAACSPSEVVASVYLPRRFA